MAIASAGSLIDALRQHELLTSDQLAQLGRQTQGRCGEVRPLAKLLIQRGWLTVYQINQLLAGQAGDLVISNYHVIDKLGQGGLSQVFKARHREHGYLVAIKMIRPEVFANEEGRAQFLQEVEAMALLDHANIVQFCDADQWGDTYYFAMEYIDGTDLGKVVRLSGALPVNLACEYIRQAAQGLQHAYERNLVHRDIKPVNLFLTHEAQPAGSKTVPSQPVDTEATVLLKPQIKILDWGLASLRQPKASKTELQSAPAGILGTADYLSPEQARNANAVDIRGDIYSLGCSFYYLLTGQAPFPDGTLMQKIIQHQREEPKSPDLFRDDVPDEVIAILKRMMAKQPENRFQTPASVALALLPFKRRSAVVAGSGVRTASAKPAFPRTQRRDPPVPPPEQRPESMAEAGTVRASEANDDTAGP